MNNDDISNVVTDVSVDKGRTTLKAVIMPIATIEVKNNNNAVGAGIY